MQPDRTSKFNFCTKPIILASLIFAFLLNALNWWLSTHDRPLFIISPEIFFSLTGIIIAGLYILISGSRNNNEKEESDVLISLIDNEHDVLTRLHKNPESIEPYLFFLKHLESVSDAISSAIYVPDDTTAEMKLLVNTDTHETPWPNDSPHDTTILSDGEVQLIDSHSSIYNIVFIPIFRGIENQAQLILRVPVEMILTEQVESTFRLCSKFMANILYISKLTELNLRNVQYEERSTIARELHDSIAQSLSYMKIQASRIQDMISNSPSLDTASELMIDDVTQDFRTTLNIAYRHLRELMSSYRITLGGRGFTQALVDSINELSSRSIIAINVDNRLPENTLTVSEEIQLLQIIRESLSNVVRHSQATYAQVSLQCHSKICVRIEDNGIGLPTSYNRERHHGIIIMQERVLSLNGSIQFNERSGGGTIIQITFHTNNQTTV